MRKYCYCPHYGDIGPHVKGLVPNLWHYWEVVGPLGDGAWWKEGYREGFFWQYCLVFVFVFFLVRLGLCAYKAGTLHLKPHSSPFFALVIWRRVLQTICLGWARTRDLLISASQVARIIGMRHQHPVPFTGV
jgi:hypothetical protein